MKISMWDFVSPLWHTLSKHIGKYTKLQSILVYVPIAMLSLPTPISSSSSSSSWSLSLSFCVILQVAYGHVARVCKIANSANLTKRNASLWWQTYAFTKPLNMPPRVNYFYVRDIAGKRLTYRWPRMSPIQYFSTRNGYLKCWQIITSHKLWLYSITYSLKKMAATLYFDYNVTRRCFQWPSNGSNNGLALSRREAII